MRSVEVIQTEERHCPDIGLGITRRYDILTNGARLGGVHLVFPARMIDEQAVRIDSIGLDNPDNAGMGYGMATMLRLPELTEGLPIKSKGGNENTKRIWEKLVERGIAHMENDEYVLPGQELNQ
jgi:hypothetical protein